MQSHSCGCDQAEANEWARGQTHARRRACGQARMSQGPEARAGHESFFPMPLKSGSLMWTRICSNKFQKRSASAHCA
jgi:hypothetical protein